MTNSRQKGSSPKTDENAAVDKGADDQATVQRSGTGFFAVLQSVFAAMIGVQSSKNKERDFTQGKPLHFIIGGLLGTLLFILAIWLLVKYLIATA